MKQIRPLMTAATLILLGAAPLAAQAMPSAGSDPAAQGKYAMMKHHASARLTVSGQGQSSAQPDMAAITLGVSSRADTAAEAMRQNAETQNAIIDTLKGAGIEPRDIQTTGLNLSPTMNYPQDGTPPELTGYAARNSVTVRVRDIAGLGAVLDQLVASGANEIGNISFAREDMTAAEDAARAAAVKDARRRAGIMAEAAGMRLGPLLRLSDTVSESQPAPVMRAMAMGKSEDATPIEAGELTVTADVTAIFAMLPADAPQDHDMDENAEGAEDAGTPDQPAN